MRCVLAFVVGFLFTFTNTIQAEVGFQDYILGFDNPKSVVYNSSQQKFYGIEWDDSKKVSRIVTLDTTKKIDKARKVGPEIAVRLQGQVGVNDQAYFPSPENKGFIVSPFDGNAVNSIAEIDYGKLGTQQSPFTFFPLPQKTVCTGPVFAGSGTGNDLTLFVVGNCIQDSLSDDTKIWSVKPRAVGGPKFSAVASVAHFLPSGVFKSGVAFMAGDTIYVLAGFNGSGGAFKTAFSCKMSGTPSCSSTGEEFISGYSPEYKDLPSIYSPAVNVFYFFVKGSLGKELWGYDLNEPIGSRYKHIGTRAANNLGSFVIAEGVVLSFYGRDVAVFADH